MADKKNKGLKEVKTNREELRKKIYQHRKKVFRNTMLILLVVAIALGAVTYIYSRRSYTEYEIKSIKEKENTNLANYVEFGDYIIEYSNDGIWCTTKGGQLVWNQSYEMSSPDIDICGEYVTVYDQGGKLLYILSVQGLQKQIETTSPIAQVRIAGQGTVAVLMKEDDQAQVKLFDKKGKELANGKFYDSKGSIPMGVAISPDAKKLAVTMLDITGKEVGSAIAFYNFDTVGQNEIDNNVGTYEFSHMLIPEIDFLSKDCLIALGTEKVILFQGSQKPDISQSISLMGEVKSYFYNEKYIGIVYEGEKTEESLIQVVDHKGKKIMECNTTLAYDTIEFLSNGEICLKNDTQCEIYTKGEILKFSYTFDREICHIIAHGKGQNYIFVFRETTEEVRLR